MGHLPKGAGKVRCPFCEATAAADGMGAPIALNHARGCLVGLQERLIRWLREQPDVADVDELGDGYYGIGLVPVFGGHAGTPVSLVMRHTE